MASLRRLSSVALTLLLLLGCSSTPVVKPYSEEPPRIESAPEAHRRPSPQPVQARILAVGDLLMHTPLVFSSQIGENQWDFKPLFEPVRPWLEGADLAIANLETTLTGDRYPWAGYPSFNTPPELARDAMATGIDVFTHANNHSLDYGEYGLKQTSDALDRLGVPHTGTSRTPEEREQILVVQVAPTIRMAILAYTYGTNGIPLPHPYSVNMLDPERIPADIRRARALPGVDLVAVALHFGDEYARQPSDEQEHYVQLTLQAGADIILGDHPHVIQKIETRQVVDKFGRDRRRAVIFSLGNFISNQVGLQREAGLMLIIDLQKDREITTIDQVSFLPTWVHTYGTAKGKRYRVVAVEKAIRDYEAQKDPLVTAADYARLNEVWADTTIQAVGSSDVKLLTIDMPASLSGR